ncbi:MAG: hypothetical protein MUE54_08400, partial [Anaerolineae bacterium]|nr:hypothetical protein [Anaerolineae bacterium]
VMGGNIAPLSVGVWGDPDSAHQALYSLGAAGTEQSAQTYTALSPNSLQEKRTAMINTDFGQSSCTGLYIGTWIAPLNN